MIDCGATKSTTSNEAMAEVQTDLIEYEEITETNFISAEESDSCFKYANGGTAAASMKVTVPVSDGLLAGEKPEFHMVDIPSNKTPGLLGMDWLMANKAIIDFYLGRIAFRDAPGVWHQLPRSDKWMLMVPLTKAALIRQQAQGNYGALNGQRRAYTKPKSEPVQCVVESTVAAVDDSVESATE